MFSRFVILSHLWWDFILVKMSFSSIVVPVERERIVEDYKRLKQEIKERNGAAIAASSQ